MKCMVIMISLMVTCSLLAQPQTRAVLGATNNLRVGDSVSYDMLDYGSLPFLEETSETWDFSNTKFLGKENHVLFSEKGDQQIIRIDDESVVDFKRVGASLYLTQFQTSLLSIDFGNSFRFLSFPLSENDSVVACLTAKGSYSSRDSLSLLGTSSFKTVSVGKLVTPDNQIIENAVLVRRNINVNVMIGKDTLEESLLEKLKFNDTVYEWYARGYRYPIMKLIAAKISKGELWQIPYKKAYYVNLESLNSLVDPLNEALRRNENDIEKNKTSEKSCDIEYKIELQGKTLKIYYSLINDAQVDFIVSNSSGVMFYSVSKRSLSDNENQQEFNCAALPSGEYVLYVSVNNQVRSKKFYLQ